MAKQKYQATDLYLPVMDKTYNTIPNKYFNIMNLFDSNYKLTDFELNPSKYMSVRELYKINGTIPVEILMNPAEDFDAYIIGLAVDRDYKNMTFIAKSRKTFRVEIFKFPDIFHIVISEKDQVSDWNIFQQILVSRESYTITYLRPFNLNS